MWITSPSTASTLGGLLFLLSAGFSLDLRSDAHPQPDAWLDVHARRLFRRDASHRLGLNFWLAALWRGLGVALFGGVVERSCCAAWPAELAQVLVTLGLSFMVADTA